MKTVYMLVGLLLFGCASGQPVSWEKASSGPCRTVAVFFELGRTPECPHHKHGAPAEYDEHKGVVGYMCYCL